jgi:hypothetical protein
MRLSRRVSPKGFTSKSALICVYRRLMSCFRELSRLDSLTERVLGAVFEVTNTLGAGFLEKVY